MARRHSTAAPSAAALDDRARTHARAPSRRCRRYGRRAAVAVPPRAQ